MIEQKRMSRYNSPGRLELGPLEDYDRDRSMTMSRVSVIVGPPLLVAVKEVVLGETVCFTST